MPGLSIYNRCIPQMNLCLSSSDADDGAYVRRVTRRQRSSIDAASGVGKGRSVRFWNSWEFLSRDSRSTLPGVSKLSDSCVTTRSVSLEEDHTSFSSKERKPDEVSPPSSWVGGGCDNLISGGDGDYSNVPCGSRGAIPKRKNFADVEMEEGVHEIPPMPDCEKPEVKKWGSGKAGLNVENLSSKGKKQESKNMKSLLQYNNHSFGRDVLDNGIALLDSKLPVHTVIDRLKTFKNWPNKRIEPKKLADAGFFYCGRADIVECFRCGIKGHNWVENDRPMEDHIKWNKDCPFVRENATEHDIIRVRQGQDICGNLGMEIMPNSRPEDGTVSENVINKNQNIDLRSETSLAVLGIQKAKGPSHPDQIICETRLATFKNWPKSMRQKPHELAAAGFYYLGVGDQTLCFYCGGGLKDWDEEDDPWEQHALWFPKCNYLLLKKTPAFVDAVHNKHKGLLSCKKEETEIEASCSSNSDTKETPSNLIANGEERKSEESMTLCKICFKNELGVVFLPCGHMVACIDCASALKECAVCRKGIQATVRAFLS